MNNKIRNILPFIATAVVTAVVIFVFCFISELELMFRCEKIVTENQLNTEHLVEFATLEQLEKRLKNEPTNHFVMIRLANIYESLGKYQDANNFYRNAVKISGRSYYSLYKYAVFCAKRGLYVLASSMGEEILSNSPKNIRYKAEIYEAMGDKMLDNDEALAAVKAFQIAYKYAKNVKDKKYFNKIQDKYALAHIKSADFYIKENMIQDAIASLNNSIKVEETSLALYKLALINIDTNKVKAQKLMEQVFKEKPYIVNPYIYNILLNDLINKAKSTGDNASLNYYSVKYNRFKNIMNTIYLYKNDVLVSNSQIIKNKEKYYLVFDFKNNTKEKIEQLYFKIDIFLNSKHYIVQKKAVHLAHTIAAYEEFKDFRIELPEKMEFVDVKDNNYVVLRFFAKKSTKAPDTLIKIDSLNF